MRNKLKFSLALFFVYFFTNTVFAFNTEMATQTARQTWWYFRQVIDDPNKNQHGFSAKMLDNNWITNVVVNDSGEYSGNIISDAGLSEQQVKFKDSSEIVDWAFVHGKILIGGFSFRIKEKTTKVELLTDFLGAEFIKQNCVTLDFIERSKRIQDPVGLDSSRSFFNRRYYGGLESFHNYLSQNMEYPSFASQIGLVGYCYVTFVVLPNGYVEHIVVEQSIGGGTAEECYRLVENVNRFKQNDNEDARRFTLPIKLLLSK